MFCYSTIVSRVLLCILALIGYSLPAAASSTFALHYDGTPWGNDAQAVGSITFAVDPPNPADTTLLFSTAMTDYAPDNIVSDFSLTVTGASVGNGTFGLDDFLYFSWNTKGFPLDLSQDLVGQPTENGLGWASVDGAGGFGLGAWENSGAPSSLEWYVLATNEGSGDYLSLTSFTPVPVPAAIWLFGSALLGLGAFRRRWVVDVRGVNAAV